MGCCLFERQTASCPPDCFCDLFSARQRVASRSKTSVNIDRFCDLPVSPAVRKSHPTPRFCYHGVTTERPVKGSREALELEGRTTQPRDRGAKHCATNATRVPVDVRS